MKAIHQFVPVLHRLDAVGQHVLGLQELLRRDGVVSEVFVEIDDEETADLTRAARSYPSVAERADVLVYQFAAASDLVPWLAARDETLVVNYHNVTPPECFAPWHNGLARGQLRTQGELAVLAARAALGVAVSEFNRRDLVAAGYGVTRVVPPIVKLADAGPAAVPLRVPSGSAWLTVGRLAPNKAVEDIIAALFYYRRTYDPSATLTVIGRTAVAAYSAALRAYAADLGVADAVTFVPRIDDEGMVAAYLRSDVLVVTSVHEGFCLPVVEAMAHRLPVVALAQGAVPEVLGGGGVLLGGADPGAIGDAVHRLAVDPAFRQAQVAGGIARVGALELEKAGTRLVELLEALHEGRPLPGG